MLINYAHALTIDPPARGSVIAQNRKSQSQTLINQNLLFKNRYPQNVLTYHTYSWQSSSAHTFRQMLILVKKVPMDDISYQRFWDPLHLRCGITNCLKPFFQLTGCCSHEKRFLGLKNLNIRQPGLQFFFSELYIIHSRTKCSQHWFHTQEA